MNNYKVYNENEIKNKLQNFTENQDYKVSPVGDGRWFYDFLSDRLKNFWGNDRVVVNRIVKTDSNKDYDYYGQFENYQDGGYRSFQAWSGKNYQDSESYRRSMKNNPFFRDPNAVRESLEFGRIGGLEPKRIEPNHDLKWKHNQLTDKLNSLLARPESDFGVNGKWKKEVEIAQVKKDIANIEREIEKEKNRSEFSQRPDWISCPVCDKTFNKNAEVWGVEDEVGFQSTCCHGCAENFKGKQSHGRVIKRGSEEYYNNNLQQKGWMGKVEKGGHNNSDLEKENQQLRQQLASVQKQLAEVWAELKKLTGKSNERLERQQVSNEEAITDGSAAKMKEQVVKSEALMRELSSQVNTASQVENDSKSSSLPYLVGGSVLVGSFLLIGGYLISKRKRGK